MAAVTEAKEEENKEVRVVITGGNRGIGLEFVKQLLQRNNYNVVACCRKPDKADELKKLQNDYKNRLSIEKLEITNDSDIESVKKSLENKSIDILILNAGILGGRDEKENKLRNIGTLTRNDFQNTFNVNVIGPSLFTQALYDNVKKSNRKQIIGITSGMGSISDCGSNSAVPYRCSKAAFNMVFQTIAKDAKKTNNGVHAIAINPGWVQTDLGGKNASKPVSESVSQMLAIIDKYKELNNGGFYNYNGNVFPW